MPRPRNAIGIDSGRRSSTRGRMPGEQRTEAHQRERDIYRFHGTTLPPHPRRGQVVYSRAPKRVRLCA